MTVGIHSGHSDACPICSGEMRLCFSEQVLGKYQANYELCALCGFLRAKDPYWLNEAYSSAIAVADTGLVMRNLAIASKLSGVLYWLVRERGKGLYLDSAGGYGMLTRLMRDFGFDFYWADKYCDNHLAQGFEYKPEMGPCNAVTAIEVFEHLTDPATFIKETLAFSGARTLIFTTELYAGDPPAPGSWWYYAFATGQHIGFFQRRTLEILGKRLGLRFSSANGIHIFSEHQIDELILRFVTGRGVSRIAPWWIRRRLGSKTLSDHQLMLQKIG
ncbi:class I SAM-dependent methyltransferase [Haematospirillum sp. H1815]|uniref:class I SAM-dependent methyltransferase n=1 Tax=Haematospirillum sp. H1815 TaxID=2723108 RepID=UPI001ADDFD67|nr:class I SAM-dependent methyltransferase [Haematospirillum sp. H1815]